MFVFSCEIHIHLPLLQLHGTDGNHFGDLFAAWSEWVILGLSEGHITPFTAASISTSLSVEMCKAQQLVKFLAFSLNKKVSISQNFLLILSSMVAPQVVKMTSDDKVGLMTTLVFQYIQEVLMHFSPAIMSGCDF